MNFSSALTTLLLIKQTQQNTEIYIILGLLSSISFLIWIVNLDLVTFTCPPSCGYSFYLSPLILYLLCMLQKTITEQFNHTSNNNSMVHSSNQCIWCGVIYMIFLHFSLCVCLCLTSQDIQGHECTTYYSNFAPI